MTYDVIVVGAGAAGLLAARELSKAGKKVCILEARDRVGGRIHTAKPDGFSKPIELGAEFIHGKLPITMTLLKEAGTNYHEDTGKTYEVQNGVLVKNQDFIEGMDQLMTKLNQLEHDMPLAKFLNEYFSDARYDNLRESVTRFAEGFDVADINDASAFALRDEWGSGDVEQSFRSGEGLSALTDFLADVCKGLDCEIFLNSIVKEINWKRHNVNITTSGNATHTARAVIVTVPLGVMQAEENDTAYIRFTPDIKRQRDAAKQLGYGGVIKFNLEFSDMFWERKHDDAVRRMHKLGFLLTDSHVRAWWSQLPVETPMLTGWIGGPQTEKLKFKSTRELTSLATDTLAYAFNTTNDAIKQQLVAAQVTNWLTDPFSLGAYSYRTVGSEAAHALLLQPVKDTLFFAGEALSTGESIGTVEAALESGYLAAQSVLQTTKRSTEK